MLLLETNGARTLGAAAGNGGEVLLLEAGGEVLLLKAGGEVLLLKAGGEGNRLPARTSLFVTYYSFG